MLHADTEYGKNDFQREEKKQGALENEVSRQSIQIKLRYVMLYSSLTNRFNCIPSLLMAILVPDLAAALFPVIYELNTSALIIFKLQDVKQTNEQ